MASSKPESSAQPKTQQQMSEKGNSSFQKPYLKTGKENLGQNVHNPLIYTQTQESGKLNEEFQAKPQPNFIDQSKVSMSDPTVTVPLTDTEEGEDLTKGFCSDICLWLKESFCQFSL